MSPGAGNLAEFQDSCRTAIIFPKNVLRSDLWEHTLEKYHSTLDADSTSDDAPELFDDDHRSIYTLDFSTDTESFKLSDELKTLDQVQDLVNEDAEDLRCRFIFIHALSARSPLGCSKEQLLHILTHYQTMPSFLDNVFSFCQRSEPHLRTCFRSEDYLNVKDQAFQIKELGRSGNQVQHCFNLVGIEYGKDQSWPFFYRQTAAYFSFDPVESRSLWIILKANAEIRNRIKQSSDCTRRGNNLGDLTTPESSFSSAMSAHLLIYEWSTDNWTPYIDFLESKILESSTIINYSPVTRFTQEKPIAQALSRKSTFQSGVQSRQNSGLQQQLNRSSRTASFSKILNPRPGPRRFSNKISRKGRHSALPSAQRPAKVKMDDLDLDEIFSFDQLQSLHRLAAELETASLVVNQNKRVMEEMLERFIALRGSPDLVRCLPVDKINFEGFFRRTQRCLRELENQQARLTTLQAGLEKDLSLFNGVLQYKICLSYISSCVETGTEFAACPSAKPRFNKRLEASMPLPSMEASRPFYHAPDARQDQETLSFIDFVETLRPRGSDGNRERQHYVSLPALEEYWDDDHKIQNAIGDNPVLVSFSILRKCFLRIFSTLVYTNQANRLSAFTRHGLNDDSFPVVKFPETHWPNEGLYTTIFRKFSEKQWMFFPLEFHRERLIDLHLAPQRILPLESKKMINDGDAAQVYEIKVHTPYNMLHDDPNKANHNTFVLKTYNARRPYDNEREALTALQNNPSKHVIAYLGSFEQNDTYNIILEHVDGGNLLDYLKQTARPEAEKDIRDLWNSMLGLFKGFHRVHQLTQHHQHEVDYRVVHQDLKPDNILLVRDPSSRYRFLLKIADFGCSHVRIVHPDGEDKQGCDRHGNPTYSAPECSHHERFLERGPRGITAKADIFSLGCVLSEVAAWIALGMEGCSQYSSLRKKEIGHMSSFRGSAYTDCFHDGLSALNAVKVMHARIVDNIQMHDNITPPILNIIHKHMLAQRPSDREEARQLKVMFEKVLEGNQDIRIRRLSPPSTPSRGFDEASSSSSHRRISSTGSAGGCHFTPTPPNTTTAVRHRPGPTPFPNNGSQTPTRRTSRRNRLSILSPSSLTSWSSSERLSYSSSSPGATSPLGEVLTFLEVFEYREAKKGNGNIDGRVANLISKLKKSLGHRDHIFLIDDSPSMCTHAQNVLHAFTVLSYLAKLIDDNGIELVFASDPSWGGFIDKAIISRLPDADHKLFGAHIPFGSRKPISAIILTDGSWGPRLTQAGGVEKPIKKLMAKIKSLHLNRTQVMIQFLRFGDDEDGQRYLKFLDEFGNDEDCDIVDTRTIHDDVDVNDIFIGSLSQARDNMQDPVHERVGF
ncbi:uncharacterized protein BCR38DRAFT_407683 [Pseudomassariella vexata]|uniref:non-specific serine/threonine protein kinase n=1 Tax=Pseudomassariella vexata TaxID=1141098 RepID=A0A1Y2E875_9PEZI|nr:uncharacterized protein BCR38DRAFT_407683 [Pseudomassariella vexata]ORY67739.1 hypothetical protein BCR38DRAFT_407683 [Pseudomassariella vexata]